MKTAITVLTIALLATGTANAANAEQVWVSGRALQLKLDRLYFNHGLDERIYPDCRFVIHLGHDSIYSGCIEKSYQGVSLSYPTHHFFDTLNTDLVHVWMERAPVDSITPIVIGHAGYLPEVPFEALKVEGIMPSERGNPIHLMPYSSLFEMSLAFDSGELDATIAYRRQPPAVPGTNTQHPAPFIVAMIPDPSRTITHNGFLTTSLYYRVDPERLPLYFEGDAIQPFNQLGLGGDTTRRPYPYNPARGRELLESVRFLSRKVTISVAHPMLAPLAGYFADILSRDKCRASTVGPDEPADVRLVMVPLYPDILTSLIHVHRIIVADTVSGGDINESVKIIGNHLAAAKAATDSTTRIRYTRLAERGLRDDIGAFSLFRPTLFYTAKPALLGNVFGLLGYPVLERLKRVRLPAGRKDCGQ